MAYYITLYYDIMFLLNVFTARPRHAEGKVAAIEGIKSFVEQRTASGLCERKQERTRKHKEHNKSQITRTQ